MKKIPFHLENTLLNRRLLPVSAISLALAVSGCASTNTIPKKLEFEHTPQQNSSSVLGEQPLQREYSETDTPTTPPASVGNKSGEQPPISAIHDGKGDLTVSFNQMPIPTFVHAIFGSVLKANYSMDPAVASRTDLVTFRTSKPQTPQQMANLARLLLKSYGVAVQDFGGMIRIVPDNAANSYSPQIKRGRAQPDTPANLRPIFYYVELESVRVGDFSSILKNMFGTTKLQITEDSPRNALLLSGSPEDVNAAMEAVQALDQPSMRGQRSKRISPAFWTADEFSRKLSDILTAEGYSVGTTASSGTPIILMPIPPLNSVIVFSSSETVMEHVLNWAHELDRPSETQVGSTYFTYPVKYADAQALAKTLSDLISPGAAAPAPATVAAPGATPAPAPAPARRSSRIVVNNATNSLIIQGGGPDEYRQWTALLTELDRPTKSALIDVMVAEISTDTLNQLGVDWNFRDAQGQRASVTGKIVKANAGPNGLTVNFFNTAGLVRADITALATKGEGQILSSPKIMARNGETATIQVGDEVPILTSTTSTVGSAFTPGTTTNTVQYRTTGIILKVRPVINSGNRIDLDVTQEVSSAKETQTGVSTSPTISNRKIDTRLTLRDGSTVMLAGLISNETSNSDSGVPLLKDVPLFGNLFKSETIKRNKKELIVLITPYIVNDDFEAEAITDAFQNSLGDWARELKERSKADKLKLSDSMSHVPAENAQSKPPVDNRSGSKMSHPPVQKQERKAPVSEPATGPASPPPPTTEAKPGANRPAKEEKESPESSGVIMSKPETPPARPPQPSSSAKPADGKTSGKTGTQGTAKSPPLPVNGKPVENEDLLEELRRAVEKK